MRLARQVGIDGSIEIVALDGDRRLATGFTDMLQLIEAGDAGLAAVADTVAASRQVSAGRLLAPLPNPGKMLFLGRIFHKFRVGLDDSAPPFVYARVASSIVGPGDPIVLPGPDDTVLYEGELLIIIGRAGRAIPAASAMDHVFGYSQVNDMTWTDWIHGGADSLPQITMSKNADTFCPMGPEIVTADAFDPHRAVCRVTVNGELRTTTSTEEMAWSISRVIEWLSTDMTLLPGDVIATGTSDAQRVLAGDEVVVEFEGLGRLANPVTGRWLQ